MCWRRVRAVLLLFALGCAEGRGWDMERLERIHPTLAAVEGQRLGDLRPYYLPVVGILVLFTCRWADAEPIPVRLPDDATPDERRRIEAALTAWEGALGVRFGGPGEEGRGIEIRLVEEMLAYSANTIADCAVDARALESAGAYALPARLVRASVHLARGDPRLAGTALHELGHALGFQGHARRGSRSIMVRDTEAQRLAGERIVSGRPWSDAALEALYALPSGTVLAAHGLGLAATAQPDELVARARREGWSGPFARVGDDEGLLFWRDRGRRRHALKLRNLRQALTDPRKLTIEPAR